MLGVVALDAVVSMLGAVAVVSDVAVMGDIVAVVAVRLAVDAAVSVIATVVGISATVGEGVLAAGVCSIVGDELAVCEVDAAFGGAPQAPNRPAKSSAVPAALIRRHTPRGSRTAAHLFSGYSGMLRPSLFESLSGIFCTRSRK
jgi:hypothetical protein